MRGWLFFYTVRVRRSGVGIERDARSAVILNGLKCNIGHCFVPYNWDLKHTVSNPTAVLVSYNYHRAKLQWNGCYALANRRAPPAPFTFN